MAPDKGPVAYRAVGQESVKDHGGDGGRVASLLLRREGRAVGHCRSCARACKHRIWLVKPFAARHSFDVTKPNCKSSAALGAETAQSQGLQ